MTAMRAHRAAVEDAMRYVEHVLGRVRMGHGGRDGAEQGHIGWVAFDHYSARPVHELARLDPATGQPLAAVTEGLRHTGLVR